MLPTLSLLGKAVAGKKESVFSGQIRILKQKDHPTLLLPCAEGTCSPRRACASGAFNEKQSWERSHVFEPHQVPIQAT